MPPDGLDIQVFSGNCESTYAGVGQGALTVSQEQQGRQHTAADMGEGTDWEQARQYGSVDRGL